MEGNSDTSQPDLFDQVESDENLKEKEKAAEKAAQLAEKKAKLERKVGTRQFDTLEARVAYVLAQFPETRNSDITLLIKYWKIFERDKVPGTVIDFQTLYEVERLTSISRARATIQNDFKLYLATSEDVARKRQQLQEEHREKRKPIKEDVPPVAIYVDDSGKNQHHFVVGSAWILVPTEEYRLYKEMNEWKEKIGFKFELKFNNISKTNKDQYFDFIKKFLVHEGVLGFKAIAMQSSGIADDGAAFADLFYFLIRRGIEHEDATGRAPLPRRITFIKDEEEKGYDDRLIALMVDRMQNVSKSVFDGRLIIESAYSEKSKGSIFLQIADLYTGCINRILNDPAPEKGWKDEFAEEVLTMLGLTNGLDKIDKLNDRAVHLSLQSPTLKGDKYGT